MSDERQIVIVIGEQAGGKSFLVEKICQAATLRGQSYLIYNLGRESDFKSAELIKLQTIRQHEEQIYKAEGKKAANDFKRYPYLENFEIEKDVHSLKDFNSIFYRKGAKTHRLTRGSEAAFFQAYYYYISNCTLVLDDAKNILRYGVSEQLITLLTRRRHTGEIHKAENYKGAGSDIILIFHSLNHVNQDVLDVATDIINFRYFSRPDFKVIKNELIRSRLIESFELLKTAPKYSYTHHEIKTNRLIFQQP